MYPIWERYRGTSAWKRFEMKAYLRCHICPRNCGVDRYIANGFCDAGADLRNQPMAQLHFGEEPVISPEIWEVEPSSLPTAISSASSAKTTASLRKAMTTLQS